MGTVIIAPLINLAVMLCIIFISISASDNKGKANSFGCSRLFSIIGIIDLIFINALFALFVWQEITFDIKNTTAVYIIVALVYVIISLIGWYLTLKGFIWKITLDETKFIFRNCIGVTKYFDYGEIKEICVFYTGKTNIIEKIKIYVKGTVIEVSYIEFNMGFFLVQLKKHISKKMRKEHNILFAEKRQKIEKKK